MNAPITLREASCADDYDSNSMPVDKARELIRTFLHPVTAIERVQVRSALDRVLDISIVEQLLRVRRESGRAIVDGHLQPRFL